MKTKLFLLLFSVAGVITPVRSAIVQTAGSLVPVNTTTSNFTAIASGNYNFPSPNFLISRGATTTTNDAPVRLQFSLDNTNWLCVATNYSTGTGATNNEVWSPGTSQQTVYWRTSVTTTNSVNIGIISQY